MKKILLLLALAAGVAHANTQVVSDFSSFAAGYYSQSDEGAWSDATAQSGATAFTLGNFGAGAPSGKIGNGFIQWLGDTPLDWSGYSFVELTGLVPRGNATPFLNFYLEDINGNNSISSQFDLSGFGSSLSTISIALVAGSVDLTQIAFWGFTVGEASATDFAFTFDHVALSDTPYTPPASNVPDTGSVALLGGVAFAGLAGVRRLRRA